MKNKNIFNPDGIAVTHSEIPTQNEIHEVISNFSSDNSNFNINISKSVIYHLDIGDIREMLDSVCDGTSSLSCHYTIQKNKESLNIPNLWKVAGEARPFDDTIICVDLGTHFFVWACGGNFYDKSNNHENSYGRTTMIFKARHLDLAYTSPNSITNKDRLEGLDRLTTLAKYGIAMALTSRKTTIDLVESHIRVMSPVTGKRKIKKVKLVRLSNSIQNKTKNKAEGAKVSESLVMTQVCGHWNYFKKGSRMKIGHDRNGNIVKGKTWINPHTRGDQESIEQQIRMWR